MILHNDDDDTDDITTKRLYIVNVNLILPQVEASEKKHRATTLRKPPQPTPTATPGTALHHEGEPTPCRE